MVPFAPDSSPLTISPMPNDSSFDMLVTKIEHPFVESLSVICTTVAVFPASAPEP